jgi:hypothetical protein
MKNEEFERKYQEIINVSLDKLGLILEEVETLDTIIKENQIRRFKKKWYNVLYNDLVSTEILNSTEFREECKYLFNRMNDKNKIEAKIVELTKEAKSELRNLK